jgi:hypothetical protein
MDISIQKAVGKKKGSLAYFKGQDITIVRTKYVKYDGNCLFIQTKDGLKFRLPVTLVEKWVKKHNYSYTVDKWGRRAKAVLKASQLPSQPVSSQNDTFCQASTLA